MSNNESFRSQWVAHIHALQDKICLALEQADGKASFVEDAWEREGGGGGKTRVMTNGNVFEKGGVNTSVVFGEVTDAMRSQLRMGGESWFACGLSLVLHPFNPFVPTLHCNYRYFELYGSNGEVIDQWFGGGTDLTPFYLFEEDAVHFHSVHKSVCDKYDPSFYPEFKKHCDDYFVNWHRPLERRGIGGIFFDFCRPAAGKKLDFWFNFSSDCGNALTDAYLPIIERRRAMPFTPANKYWQEIRRGRYVEFNLVHDRGTLFGLKTNGRTESILMSLPPTVRFDYNYQPTTGSDEDKLLQVCLHPREWVVGDLKTI